jgi:pimeloyl-ACP methyl ester carboxylesterase
MSQAELMRGRETVEFASQGIRCEAWCYRPEGGGRRALIVLGHGLGGTRQLRMDAYAERFAAAGYACLAFDYRNFGGSDGLPRGLVDVAGQLDDWRAAIAYARALPDVDASRIVLFGTSLGGGHVLSLAADDPDLAAIILQCPFTDGRASGGSVPLRTRMRVGWRSARDLVAARAGRDPVVIAGVGPPGAVALMTSSDAEPGARRLRTECGLPPVGDPVPARIALRLMAYRPARTSGRISCPTFVALCTYDEVTPADQARRHLTAIPLAEFATYPIGHFELMLGEPFERVVADELDFLARHVPATHRVSRPAGRGRSAAAGPTSSTPVDDGQAQRTARNLICARTGRWSLARRTSSSTTPGGSP